MAKVLEYPDKQKRPIHMAKEAYSYGKRGIRVVCVCERERERERACARARESQTENVRRRE